MSKESEKTKTTSKVLIKVYLVNGNHVDVGVSPAEAAKGSHAMGRNSLGYAAQKPSQTVGTQGIRHVGEKARPAFHGTDVRVEVLQHARPLQHAWNGVVHAGAHLRD